MAQLAAESLSALNHIAIQNDAAAEACSDDHRDRCFFSGSSKNIEVTPQRASISIIQIADRFAEPLRQALANIVFRPIGMHKIRGAFGAKFSGGTRRPRRIQSYRHNL